MVGRIASVNVSAQFGEWHCTCVEMAPQEVEAMRPVWLLAGCALAVFVLSLAVLEVVGGRVRVEPQLAVSDPSDDARDSWQVVPLTARESAGTSAEVDADSAGSPKPHGNAVAASSNPTAPPIAATEESHAGRAQNALVMQPVHPVSETR